MTTEPTPPTEPRALPARAPRPVLVHFGIDSAVAFLALVVLGLIVGVPWLATAVISLVIGAVACRYTHRAEVRALAARERPPA